jgi:hypothetical protein
MLFLLLSAYKSSSEKLAFGCKLEKSINTDF